MPVTTPLPGEADAKRLGYSVHAHGVSNYKPWADYNNGRLFLRVHANGQALLTAQVGLVELRLGPFSFPHPKFAQFEAAVAALLPEE